jgi:hypothetical protein
MFALRMYRLFILVTFTAMIGLCSTGQAQRLHNQKKEEQAQQALNQAEEIKSAALFETLLKNMKTVEAQDLALVMRNSERGTRKAINSFMTWGIVFARVDGLRNRLELADKRAETRNRSLESAKADLGQEMARARAALAALRKNANNVEDESLSAQFAGLSGLESTSALIAELAANAGIDGTQIEALDKAQKIVAELADLFQKVDARVRAIQELKDQLGGFNEALQKIALQSLEIEAEHLKMLAAIEARRGIELADARLLIRQFDSRKGRLENRYYGSCFGLKKKVDLERELIVDTFNHARSMSPCARIPSELNEKLPANEEAREAVGEIMQDLLMATTIISRVQLSSDLAELRSAQENHRYSLRRRALQASAYELTLTAGAQRLALFYKGGIKPSQIAQLIYNVANIATPIAIFAK